mmetsp:Transcript_29982/g.5416  ORF Transcript_29982/g.5416 Transcript_29982/m.5416 type:complete len:91 (-) Transcript_29982:498-770(-)
MYSFDVDRFKVSEINYHRIQPSCRIALMSKEIFITGGLKTPNESFAVNRKTKEGRRLADLCEGRAFHSILFHLDSLYILGGRSIDKRTAL